MLVNYDVLCSLIRFHKMMGVSLPWTILRPGLFFRFRRFAGDARGRCSGAPGVRVVCVLSDVYV